MDTSSLAFPKPRPRSLEKADRRKVIEARDKRESDKVTARSGGRCEALIDGVRCARRACQVHHLMGGIGVRGIGDSALAANKVHVCEQTHKEIHAHVLLPLGGNRFQRVR